MAEVLIFPDDEERFWLLAEKELLPALLRAGAPVGPELVRWACRRVRRALKDANVPLSIDVESGPVAAVHAVTTPMIGALLQLAVELYLAGGVMPPGEEGA